MDFYTFKDKAVVHRWNLDTPGGMTVILAQVKEHLSPDNDGFIQKKSIEELYESVLKENFNNVSFEPLAGHMKTLEERYNFEYVDGSESNESFIHTNGTLIIPFLCFINYNL